MKFTRHIKYTREAIDTDPILGNENGCLEMDALDIEIQDLAMSNAIAFETLHLHAKDDAPVIDFGSLQSFFDVRAKRYNVVGNKFSWELDGNYFFNQGNVGSCTGHAAAHAYMASNRHILLHTDPTALAKNINPIGAWFRSKNWSKRGGQSVSRMAAEVNEFGNVPISEIGTNNISPDKNAIVKAASVSSLNQSGICFFNATPENVINFVRSGIGVFIGNALRVSGTHTDKNGLRVPDFRGTWAHATSFVDYCQVADTDYVFWLNSWGLKYNTQDLLNAPAWGCWMNTDHLSAFLKSCSKYGRACAVFAE
jgi:hypothetical protein